MKSSSSGEDCMASPQNVYSCLFHTNTVKEKAAGVVRSLKGSEKNESIVYYWAAGYM